MRWAAATFVLALSGAPAPGAAAIHVVDDSGRNVSLVAPARRIISLAPHLTEHLFALGAGDRIVGTVAYSDHPPAALALPRVGDHVQLDLERIVALRPDLIVAWESGNSAAQVQRLVDLGLNVYRSEAREFKDIAANLRRLGALTGEPAAGQREAAAFEAALAALQARYAPRREVRVFYQIWHQPLLTVSRHHLLSQALTMCGARNVFAGLEALTPQVDEEAVWAARPDVVVTGSVEPDGSADHLDRWRERQALRASTALQLVVVNPDTLHRATSRVVHGVAELCEKLDAVRAALPSVPMRR
jgi:iron complex transport system substrate-binding protein